MRNTFTVRHTTSNIRGTDMLTLSKPTRPTTTTYGLHSFSYFSSQQWHDFKRRVQRLNTFD